VFITEHLEKVVGKAQLEYEKKLERKKKLWFQRKCERAHILTGQIINIYNSYRNATWRKNGVSRPEIHFFSKVDFWLKRAKLRP